MPHHGQYEHVKEWFMDHDADVVNVVPPVQNTWYEVFHAYDVRLLLCMIYQQSDDVAAKEVEVRWTIDGNVYLGVLSLDDSVHYSVYKDRLLSAGGTAGLTIILGIANAGYSVDKRGLGFKVEVRMTAVPGTNQHLLCWCIRETLEVT